MGINDKKLASYVYVIGHSMNSNLPYVVFREFLNKKEKRYQTQLGTISSDGSVNMLVRIKDEARSRNFWAWNTFPIMTMVDALKDMVELHKTGILHNHPILDIKKLDKPKIV